MASAKKHVQEVGEMTEAEAAHQAGGALIAAEQSTQALTLGDGNVWEVAEQVTRPVLQTKDNEPLYVLFDGPIHIAPDITERKPRGSSEDQAADADAKKEKRTPPMIADVTNLQTGELRVLVIGAVLWRTLEEKYPDNAYVGRAFAMNSQLVPSKGDATKRIRVYDVKELRKRA